MGQIVSKWDKSGTFFLDLLSESKHTEICAEKVLNLSHLGSIWPSLDPNLVSLIQRSVHPANPNSVLFDVSFLPKCHNVDCVP